MSAKHLGGYVEITRTVDSIRVGPRQRTDLGDLTDLIASIQRHGLLQPITVTPDGQLVCGARRLAALRSLEYRTVSVWVRAVSGRLGLLLAEQEENRHHKPLTTLEAAALYAELKAVYAAEAAHRQELTRFALGGEQPRANGPLDSAAPGTGRAGTARSQAARMVSGRDSSTRFEQVLALHRLAAADGVPPEVQQAITVELDRINVGAPVSPAAHRVKAQLELVTLDERIESPDTAADERRRMIEKTHAIRQQLASSDAANAMPTTSNGTPHRPRTQRRARGHRDTRSVAERFADIWGGVDEWWSAFDASALAPVLTEAQWKRLVDTVEGMTVFVREVAAARRLPPDDAGE